MSKWFLKSESRPETGKDQVWIYSEQNCWYPMYLTGEKKMLFNTKGEALFALQQVMIDDEDDFEYSVEEVH